MNLASAVNWPTPTASDHTGPGKRGQGGMNLRTAAVGSLNPEWVESLMGFPPGWTEAGPADPESPKRNGRRRGSRKASKTASPDSED